MSEIFKFFVNGLKAIVLSPFYLAYYAICFVLALINHLVSEIKVLFSGFKYGQDADNVYLAKLESLKAREEDK